MKVIYTDAAEQEMRAFHERQKRLLEELVAEKKFVYGDETLEITASDIKEAADQIRPYRPTHARFRSFRLAAQIYVIIGLMMMIGAYFYPKLEAMLNENKSQALIFVTGAALVFIGMFAAYFYRLRLQRYDEIEREMKRRRAEVERMTVDFLSVTEDSNKKSNPK